jgi:hypothetical protein
VPKIQLDIKTEDSKDLLKLDGKCPAPANIPHHFRIAATIASGKIAVKGSKVGLKHLGDKNYLLTFE